MIADGVGDSTAPDGAGAEFAMISMSCGLTVLNGAGLSAWASIAYCLIMVGRETRMLCKLSQVLFMKLFCESTNCLLNCC